MKKAISTAVLCCLAGATFAQTDVMDTFDIDQVVVTGTRTENRLSEAPVPVELITERDLDRAGVTTFDGAMNALSPSFSFATNAMGSYMNLNGLSNRYILVLVDGRKLYGDVAGNTDLSRIDMGNVRRIEVLKGAASALYGSDAIGGVINVITDRHPNTFYASSNTRYSAYGQFSQSLNAEVNAGRFSSQTSYQRNQSDGWRLSPYETTSRGEVIDAVRYAVNRNYSDVGSQKFTFRPSDAFSFYVDGSLSDHKLIRPAAAYNFDMVYEDYTLGGGLRYTPNDKSLITVDFHTDNFEYYEQYITDKVAGFAPGERALQRRQRYYDVSQRGEFELGANNRLSVGTQFQVDYIKSDSDVAGGSRDVYTASVYAQDEIKLFSGALQLVPGVRYVYNQTFGNRITPKLSAMVTAGRFRFRASYASGFRTPDMKQLFIEDQASRMGRITLSLGNPGLKPETSDYYSLNADFANRWLTLSVTGYINQLKDMITTRDISDQITPEEAAAKVDRKQTYVNSSRARVDGLEFSANAFFGAGLSLGLGYSYADTEDKDTGKPIVRSSPHIATGNLNWSRRWWIVETNINFNGRFQSARYFEDEDSRNYNLWNLATTHRFQTRKGLTLEPGFGVENLFNFVDDRPFGVNYATLSPGRMFYVSLGIIFGK
jgi:outer membrane receptor for ferrienterochelin and colicins